MRTTVIPAQVTTVEDTIAGNLTLTQINLLITPVLFSTIIYATLPQRMAFSPYKIPLIAILALVCIILSLRIKGRLVLNWLKILISYLLRPHLYLFNKNTTFSREVMLAPAKERQVITEPTTTTEVTHAQADSSFDYESLFRDTDMQLRFTKKGLLVVKNV